MVGVIRTVALGNAWFSRAIARRLELWAGAATDRPYIPRRLQHIGNRQRSADLRFLTGLYIYAILPPVVRTFELKGVLVTSVVCAKNSGNHRLAN